MSTNIRKALIRIFFEKNGQEEKQALNRRIGEYFESITDVEKTPDLPD